MTAAGSDEMGQTDLESMRKLKSAFDEIKKQLTRVIVGQDQVIEELLIALFSRGHCILVGVSGLAMTLIIPTLPRCLPLNFSRIQFPPNLMPSNTTGTRIIEEDVESRRREFNFLQGPLFANIVLADEVNRTPPKTQAA